MGEDESLYPLFSILVDWCSLQKVCVPDSIFHTLQLQNSTHHWQWSISCSEGPVYECIHAKNVNYCVYEHVLYTLCVNSYPTSGAVHFTGIFPP